MCECVHHVRKIGDYVEAGRRHLSPLVAGLLVSPAAGLLALVSIVTISAMIPAEGVCTGVHCRVRVRKGGRARMAAVT